MLNDGAVELGRLRRHVLELEPLLPLTAFGMCPKLVRALLSFTTNLSLHFQRP